MNWTLHCGDARAVLETLPSESVNCVVTSPPYWGLRDYGTARWEGGDDSCPHRAPATGGNPKQGANKGNNNAEAAQFRDACGLCGARRVDSQIGLEPSPDAFVAALVDVFAGVRRVLRDDGTAWLNLGDSYSANRGYQVPDSKWVDVGNSIGRDASQIGLQPKNLIGIPWRVAFALQADGWYLRSDVIWAKPNPMPESVTDRPTKAHEYVFLLTKSERYAYDADAIRLPVTEAMLQQMAQGYDGEGLKDYDGAGVQNQSDVKARIIAGQRRKADAIGINGRNVQAVNAESERRDIPGGSFNNNPRLRPQGIGANARTVWQIPTEASPFEHFAVMPKALARKCILAGSQFGGVVLDPFAGVATTGVVALEEGRSFVGIELNPKYHAMARERLANVAPLLATEIPA